MLFDYFKNITFTQPWFFTLLILVPVLIIWYASKTSKQHGAILISDTSARGLTNWKTSLRHLPFIFRLLVIIFIIGALARPQTIYEEQNVEGEGLDIILCIDVSGSMTAQDLTPNRLEAAKKSGC